MSEMKDLFSALDAVSGSNSEEIREHYLRAPFSCLGSKFKGLDEILPRLPYRNGFCEPFGGSGVVLLNRNECPLEVFNDRHSGITAFYRCLRDPVKKDALIERIELSVHSREEFIWSKDTWKDITDDL